LKYRERFVLLERIASTKEGTFPSGWREKAIKILTDAGYEEVRSSHSGGHWKKKNTPG
jgi:hypothetical protein